MEDKYALEVELEALKGQISGSSLATPLHTSSASAPMQTPNAGRSLQMTLGAFNFTVRDKETGHAKSLPKDPIAESDALLPKCTGCNKKFKSKEGADSHRLWCKDAIQLRKDAIESMRLKMANRKLDSTEAREDSSDEDVNTEDERIERLQQQRSTLTPARTRRMGSEHRKRYTPVFKAHAARMVRELNEDHVPGAQRLVADMLNISEANISRWVVEEASGKLLEQVSTFRGLKGRGKRGRLLFGMPRGPKARFPAAETACIAKFNAARELGKRVGYNLFRVWMKAFVRELYGPVHASRFSASRNWFHRLCYRNSLGVRHVTNKKSRSAAERAPQIQRWHKRWQFYISNADDPQDDIFGRYAPRCILNADQSPLCLAESDRTTWDRKGAKVVRVATKESADKRFCTLQIC